MALTFEVRKIGTKRHRILVYHNEVCIGEYERSNATEIERKKREASNAEPELLAIYKDHGKFVVRWDRKGKKKSIRVNKVEKGTIPEEKWETPEWEK